jgi:hypothetical protein
MEGQKLLDKRNEERTIIKPFTHELISILQETNDSEAREITLDDEDIEHIIGIYENLMSLDELTEQQAQTINNILAIAEFDTSLDELIIEVNQLALDSNKSDDFQKKVWECVLETE